MENKQSVNHVELIVGIVAGISAARLIGGTVEPFWAVSYTHLTLPTTPYV